MKEREREREREREIEFRLQAYIGIVWSGSSSFAGIEFKVVVHTMCFCYIHTST